MRERFIHRGLLGEANNGDILGEATKSISEDRKGRQSEDSTTVRGGTDGAFRGLVIGKFDLRITGRTAYTRRKLQIIEIAVIFR
jgi:hypothetical protein